MHEIIFCSFWGGEHLFG